MEEAAEQIASVYNSLVILAQDGQLGRRVWRLQQQRPVGTVAVVMLKVDPKDLLEVAAPTISSQSRHSAWTVRTQRSACAFALGARIGVRSTSPPSAWNSGL
jgi:hypothetical protein